MSFVTTIKDYYLKLSDLPNHILKDLDMPLKEVKANYITSEWKTSLGVKRVVNDLLAITRIFPINLRAGLTLVKDMESAPHNLKIGVRGHRVANAGQVIGDIRFYDTVLNETSYDRTLTPYGYGKWKEMITGDYIYTKALCKYCIQASLNADRPNTRQYLHKVDVPDVTDRGTVELTLDNQPLFVPFTDDRMFHIVPEVNVTLKSFSGVDLQPVTVDDGVAINVLPVVIPYNVTTKGFYVTMKYDGEFVEGKVTYAARGY